MTLASIATFTYHYLLAVFVAGMSTLLLSLLFSTNDNYQFASKAFRNNISIVPFFTPIIHCFPRLSKSRMSNKVLLLSNEGEISFSGSTEVYLLQPSSRFSFLGCWLVLSADKNTMNLSQINSIPKPLFIFRDSVSKHDFSRIAHVINQL